MDKTKLRGGRPWNEILLDYALYLILGIMIIGVFIVEPSFASANNMWKILAQASTRGILALGVAGMIVLTGTDLSAGRILAVSYTHLWRILFRLYPEKAVSANFRRDT